MKTKTKLKVLTARLNAVEATLAAHLVKDHQYEEDEQGLIHVEEPMAPTTLTKVGE